MCNFGMWLGVYIKIEDCTYVINYSQKDDEMGKDDEAADTSEIVWRYQRDRLTKEPYTDLLSLLTLFNSSSLSFVYSHASGLGGKTPVDMLMNCCASQVSPPAPSSLDRCAGDTMINILALTLSIAHCRGIYRLATSSLAGSTTSTVVSPTSPRST